LTLPVGNEKRHGARKEGTISEMTPDKRFKLQQRDNKFVSPGSRDRVCIGWAGGRGCTKEKGGKRFLILKKIDVSSTQGKTKGADRDKKEQLRD